MGMTLAQGAMAQWRNGGKAQKRNYPPMDAVHHEKGTTLNKQATTPALFFPLLIESCKLV